MKIILLFLLSFVLLFSSWSCSHTSDRTLASTDDSKTVEADEAVDDDASESFDKSNQDLSTKFGQYQELVEETLVWRTKAMEFHKRIEEQAVYTNKDLVIMHEKGTESYKRIREAHFALIKAYNWVVRPSTKVEIIRNGPTTYKKSKPMYSDDMIDGSSLPSRISLKINPADPEGADYVKNIKMALSSALLLYDNYLLVLQQYQKMKKIRRIINQDNGEYPDYLKEVNDSFNDISNYDMVDKAITLYKEIRSFEKKTKEELDGDSEYLNAVVESSYFYSEIGKISRWTMWWNKVETGGNLIRDRFFKIRDGGMNEASKLFGNSVGMVQSRSGKLFNMSEQERADVKSKLQPLDVLLEKTPFRLTDRFIPGHCGHVAVWVGTEEELQALGVWDLLPQIYASAVKMHGYSGPSFQEAIRSGHNIVEALRPGVQINSLEHFLDIDDMGVIRPRELSVEKKQEYLVNAFEQIGKEYDFNFNVETDKKIVCSELAYVVFYDDEYQWPTDKALGRQTISPDHVAKKAVEGDLFFPTLIYHDGKRLSMLREKLDYNFQMLLETKYDQVDWEQ